MKRFEQFIKLNGGSGTVDYLTLLLVMLFAATAISSLFNTRTPGQMFLVAQALNDGGSERTTESASAPPCIEAYTGEPCPGAWSFPAMTTPPGGGF